MSIIINGGSTLGFFGGAAAGYEISRSLRFNSADSAYLSRTPASAGNRKTWTWAGWVKRSGLGANHHLMRVNDNVETAVRFKDDNSLHLYTIVGATYGINLISSSVYRDTSAWYHVVFSVDTTQATASNRAKVYVNGVQVTTFATETYPSQNYDTGFNQSSVLHTIGSSPAPAEFFPGYLADIHFIDGQALTPTSFGEFSATTGVWMPKAYTGTYGTNGFKLNFSDNSAATATTLGKDSSGNGNNWTPNNLSVTAGAGNDSLVDVPTNGTETDTGVGGEVRGNYCTWNPLDQGGSITLANGNLDVTTPSSGLPAIRGTVAVSSGKWYFEHYVQSGATSIGILKVTDSVAGFLGGTSGGYSYYSEGAGYTKKINNNVQTDYGASFVAGDTIGVAFDLDAGTITFYKNGSSQGQAFSGLSGTFAPAVSDGTNVGGIVGYTNFGQRPFAYTAPSGFKALCTANLPAPVVTKPSDVFAATTYVGNGSSQAITTGFNPDLVWIKRRDGSGQDHVIQDVVRGFTTTTKLSSSSTAQENAGTDSVTDPKWGYVSGTGATSFTVDASTSGDQANKNTWSYAAWAWDAGSTTVTNTAGSITSSVRANATAGFSVVTYSGANGGTVGHGLNVTPSLLIVKCRSAADAWVVYHKDLGATNTLQLQSTNAVQTSDTTAFNSTAPTSTVFSVGSSGRTGESGRTYVCYAFSPVVGYSSMGSYVGNGSSSSGSFVYTGFRPRFLLVKSSTGAENWDIYDAARNQYNLSNLSLQPNLSGAEYNAGSLGFDFLSNGFRSIGGSNTSGATYIYFAVAESPFQYARAR